MTALTAVISVFLTINNTKQREIIVEEKDTIRRLYKLMKMEAVIKDPIQKLKFFNCQKEELDINDQIFQKCKNPDEDKYEVFVFKKGQQNRMVNKKDKLYIDLTKSMVYGNFDFQSFKQSSIFSDDVKQSLENSANQIKELMRKHKEQTQALLLEMEDLKGKYKQQKYLTEKKNLKIQQITDELQKSKNQNNKIKEQIKKTKNQFEQQKKSAQKKKLLSEQHFKNQNIEIQNIKKQLKKAHLSISQKQIALESNSALHISAMTQKNVLSFFSKNTSIINFFCNNPVIGQNLITGFNNYFKETRNEQIKQITLVHNSLLIMRNSDCFKNIYDKENLLLICLTQKKSLIGAFTRKPIRIDPIVSSSKDAFLFDLHPQSKIFRSYPCKDAVVASYDVDYICFGAGDIEIEKATRILRSNFPKKTSPVFQKYSKKSSDKVTDVTGDKGHNFLVQTTPETEVKLQIYELFTVEFKKQQQP